MEISTDLIAALYQQYLVHSNIAIDARQLTPGAIFFALQGTSLDGNLFAAEALKKGASYAVIDDAQYKMDARYILVEDVLSTLQRLANHHRRQCNIPVIGITGSSGKTTTKELIQAVLRCRYVTTATKGNLNNHIGVPLTLLSIKPETEIAVVEMGANHVGEIAQLCQIAMPTHGLITNVGRVHMEGFGSLEGVMRGKGELYNYLQHNKGVVFLNSIDDTLAEMAKSFSGAITYPQQANFLHCQLVEEKPFVTYRRENGQIVASNLLGRYHFYNIAAALCVAKYFAVDATKANEAIKSYCPQNNRSQIIKRATNAILLDAYNANLASTIGAIKALHLIPSLHKVLILGDMDELGEESEEAHQALVAFTTQATYKAVLLCGPRMVAAKSANSNALYFLEKSDLAAYLGQQSFSNTALLIKASRSLQLETVLAHIC
jgi:UDP-N-acetylmuramoyl-tripeptide--D-alanyl-D-alanine ligase